MSWTSGPLTVERYTYARNLVRYAGGGTGTVGVTRTATYADGRVEAVVVAGAGSFPGSVPGVWVDGDVPYGSKVASIRYGVGATTITVPAEVRAWSVLSNPLTGLSVKVIGAEVGARSWHSSTSVSWLDVAIDGAPLIEARPEQAARQSLSLYTTTRGERDAVATLCAARTPLLLRMGESGVDDMWFALVGERVEERLFTQQADDEWRKHSWECYTVPRPSSTTPHAGSTLGDVRTDTPTDLAAVAAKWATLGDIAAAVLVPEPTA